MRTVVKCFGQLNFKIFFRVVSLICSRCVIVFVLKLTRRAGERSEAEQSASTNMAFVTVWFLEKPGTELTPVENCLRAVLELVRRRQNSNVLKVHSFPVILILNMPWFLRCSLSKRQ